MRILYFTPFAEGHGGGEGKITWELAHESVKIGNDVVMLSPNITKKQFEKSKSYELNLFLYPALSILHQFYAFTITPGNIQKLYAFLDEFDPDIIHFHTIAPFVFLLESWAIKNQKTVLHSIHENPNKFFSYFAVKSNSLLDRVTKKIGMDDYIRTMFYYTDCLVSVNNRHNKEIRRFGYVGPLVTILNGRNLEKFNSLSIPSLKSDTIKLFFVGFISERKNQRYLLDVLALLPENYELYLIGEPIFQKYQDNLPKSKRVHYLGQLPFDDLPKIIEKFHFCVSASLEEAFSLSIIEALAAGKPVIGLSNDTIDRLITNKNGANLPINTPPSKFAKKIESLQEMGQGNFEIMASSARESVKELDWQQAMKKYQKLYISLQNNKKKPKDLNVARKTIHKFGTQDFIKKLLENANKERKIVTLSAIGTILALVLTNIAVGTSLLKTFTRKK